MSVRCRPARSSLSSTTLTCPRARSSPVLLLTCPRDPSSAWFARHATFCRFQQLTSFLFSSHRSMQVWQGRNAVAGGRKLLGETKPQDSAPGTIRGDFAVEVGRFVLFTLRFQFKRNILWPDPSFYNPDRSCLQQHLPRKRQR